MQFDGNIVDMTTISVGVAASAVSPLKRFIGTRKPYFNRDKAISDILNGVTLVPFLMMVGSVFSSDILNGLMSSAKITVAIGGLAGLAFVIGEIFNDKTS